MEIKSFKDRVDNFFKWVKGTELVLLNNIDVNEDPVRPHLDLNFRTSYGRQIYGLAYDDNIEGIVCVALTDEIPHTEKELELMSKNSYLEKKFNNYDSIHSLVSKKGGWKRNNEKSYKSYY
jgi:hypothetical protein